MFKSRYVILLILSLLVVSFAVACGGGAAAPTATPEATVAATAVTGPTSASAAPPTASGPLADALDKSKGSTNYRLNVTVTGEGNFGGASIPTPTGVTSTTPISLVNLKGETSGPNVHFTIQGIMTQALGMTADQVFEVIADNGTIYIKGPVPAFGVTDDKWYIAPPEASQLAQPPLTPMSFLNQFGQSGVNPSDFTQSGNESLDGKSCDIYGADKSAVVNAFNRLGSQTGATQEDLDSIEAAEFKFWVCDDGYIHQIRMYIQGHDKTDTTQKGSFEILMKISDYDAAIAITPPTDAIPMPTQPPPPTDQAVPPPTDAGAPETAPTPTP